MRLSLLPIFLRETLAPRSLARVAEPSLVMESADQVEAYHHAGRVDGAMAPVYLFNTARLAAAIRGCREVLDLACGPANQLVQLAELCPETRFTGVDLSTTMLARAEALVKDRGLANVRFIESDITTLGGRVSDAAVDGVVSTMALHHLPSIEALGECFREIARVLTPGGAVCLIDLGRLKADWTTRYFARSDVEGEPESFVTDYESSLRAAFVAEDFRRASALHLARYGTRVYVPVGIAIMLLATTPSRGLEPLQVERLRDGRARLPAKKRRLLDELRFFFRLGGLPDDPFRGAA